MTKLIDKDLLSVQETRDLLRQATAAQAKLAKMSQTEVDTICLAIKDAALANAERLGKMANEETGYGKAPDKAIKNYFAAQVVYDYIKDMKTVGIVNHDEEHRLFEVAVPVGVIAGLIPSTNPTSTVIYKALVAIKAGNAIIFSPHPGAKNCIIETVEVVRRAAEAAGLPAGCISVLKQATKEGTDELLCNRQTCLILATGGEAMVRAAYSSGNPAIGVGPGNGPAYIEKSADVPLAVKRIIDSKTFDNGVICASEQSIIVERETEAPVLAELQKQGCYLLSEEEKQKVDAILMTANMTPNQAVVGKTAVQVAEIAGVIVPQETKLLIGRETQVGKKIPFSREKLCPVLAFFVVNDWQEACALAIKILNNEGAGHTMIMHSNNADLIREFALEKPVSRLLINTPGALGGIGATTMLAPALTLGCGAVGGSSTSDNITPQNLLNFRRIAYGTQELADIRQSVSMATKAGGQGAQAYQKLSPSSEHPCRESAVSQTVTSSVFSVDEEDQITSLVDLIYAKLKDQKII
ncbi:MAG: acetaldehyde dehydrogenase (acetylating) [Coriobacteriales bacterium]|jgi:acetaldehyde dehydrogenase (acetylating)|nr:acetaldehyde dehydrogenase (acetylating) [Coriobacteriales bacterium]